MNNKLLNKIKIIAFILLFGIFSSVPIVANASEIPVQFLGAYQFKDHRGMVVKVNGRWVYCIERGNPFRSSGSDMQMIWTSATSGGAWGGYTSEGYLSEVLANLYDLNDFMNFKFFRGWGQWVMNEDKTDAYQIGTDGAPSSTVWWEEFDEDKEDDEDPAWEGRYLGGELGGPRIPVRKWFEEIGIVLLGGLTGHEGAVEPYPTNVKRITYGDVGLSESQAFAMGITQYYCWEDPDSEGYDERVRYGVKQALDWGIEFNFITTIGGTGDSLRLIYQDSTGNYGVHKAYTYSGSCDGYIKTTIGTYEELKLYRQVVWKTTNMRMIPSFASKTPGGAEPIKLYWDEEQHLYTATVSDHNGVLNYFDFSVPGCTVTNNGDGTLTISSSGPVNTTSGPSKSKLEPEDGVFNLPSFFRWVMEGEEGVFNYTVMKVLRTQSAMETQMQEAGSGRESFTNFVYVHSHYYEIPCNWFCSDAALQAYTEKDCTKVLNDGWKDYDCDCELENGEDCDTDHGGEFTKHKHEEKCKHYNSCPYFKGKGGNLYWNGIPSSDCERIWCCGKEHFDTEEATISGIYIDWQDLEGEYVDGQKLIDPEICYIKVETVPHIFPAETDVEILLIADNDEWNNLTYTDPNGKSISHCDHLRVGEKFHLKYVYSYVGASKGFRIVFSTPSKPYYQYNYLARMQRPEYDETIYELRKAGLAGDRFSKSSINVPHAVLVQDLTPITIRGLYTTPETAYTLNGTYFVDSGSSWNDQIYLDALVTDQFDDNYDNKPAGSITSNNGNITAFSVTKPEHNKMIVVWEYDMQPQVFTSALVYASAYIEVGENDNFTKNYFDEAYNYAKDELKGVPTNYTPWSWGFGDSAHNDVGGVGYFSSEYTGPGPAGGLGGPQSDNPIPNHTVYTQNNEYLTYAVRNKVWQSNVDIQVSNFVENTGAGITEHIYQERGRDNHDLNYNLYYTIDVLNPDATIFADKQRSHDGTSDSETNTTPIDTTSDVYEFDVNNLITWGSTGVSQTNASYGNTVVVDHIKTGTTYIQREIPTVLATITNGSVERMGFSIYPNHDRLVYEDHYTGVDISGSGTSRRVYVPMKDGYYPPNEQSHSSNIYPAMNPNIYDMRPTSINRSQNVPDEYHQGDNVLQHIAPITTFNIKLSNGEVKQIVDSHTKNYTQYDFEYNPSNRNNKVTFSSPRKSVMFFKYSKTNYDWDGRSVQSAVGEFRNAGRTQTESYYISQVLFKSNYTSKYKKELEAQGADYIEDFDATGTYLTDAWIDMVNQNKFAIVSAGQGFELRVTLKYENSLLTQYLARYFGLDDAQNDIIGTSNRVQKRYNDVPANSRQYANISALTGKDGRGAPFYTSSERAYISSYSILDTLAVNLVTGANVFNDLYVFMSDNPDTVYSYSGIYDTPVVFERDIKYSQDYSVTTITYTMCVSHENGIASNLQKMRFYTNQLAPDKKSPGIVENNYDVSANGEHSITIWTPIVAATPFDYPDTMQDRYIGDAIELGYTIKTTGADDAIVHIVQ